VLARTRLFVEAVHFVRGGRKSNPPSTLGLLPQIQGEAINHARAVPIPGLWPDTANW